MHIKSRSYLTAGIATLGVGALALAPVQPIPQQELAQQPVVSTLAVELASTIDPITPWVTAFQTAFANIGILGQFYMQKPFPLLQTTGANLATIFEELTTGNAGVIPEQIWNNIQTFFQAPWDPGAGFDLPSPPLPEPVFFSAGEYASKTKPDQGGFSPQSGLPGAIFQLEIGNIEACADAQVNCDQPGQVAPVQNFLNNHFSGQLLGVLGPVLSPIVQLVKSFTAIGEFFQAGDVIGAINELINIPANMTNAFLNGAGYLDLTAIAEQFLPVPPGTIKSIGINLGGLLNAVPQNGSLTDPDNPPTEYAGGVGYDSIAADLGLVKFGGLPNGPLGAAIGLGQFLSEKLLITPPQEAPASAKLAAPEAAAPALPAAPAQEAAPVEAPVEDTAPADFGVAADDPAPADDAGADAGAAVVSEVLEVEAPADFAEVTEIAEVTEVAADPAPEATVAAGSDDSESGDTGRASDSRRGAADAD